MTKNISIRFKGKDITIMLGVLQSDNPITLKERRDALLPYVAYLSPASTLKAAECKFKMLEEMEAEVYCYTLHTAEYLRLLSNTICQAFPSFEVSTNSGRRKTVIISQDQLDGLIGFILNVVTKFNDFALIKYDSGYKEIIKNVQKMNYQNIQDMSNDIQKILIHLESSIVKRSAKKAEEMLESYSTQMDPIFQHIGYCCSAIAEAGSDNVIRCKICKKHFHQLCENYVPSDDNNAFVCRQCKHLNPSLNYRQRKTTLRDLKDCQITTIMETKITAFLNTLSFSVPEINVRMVYNNDKSYESHRLLQHHFEYPATISYRKKVFIAFQKVQDQEVILFYLEVHEYGENQIRANKRIVNIAYIDSVQYMVPENKEVRRGVYYSIIQGYLQCARQMGFLKAYIWISPPEDSQEYVFNEHPIPYYTPTRPSLQNFYNNMLEDAKRKKIISSFTSIENKAPFKSGKYDVKNIPYFNGDFWYIQMKAFCDGFLLPTTRKFRQQLLADIKKDMLEPVNANLMLIVDLMSVRHQSLTSQNPIRDVNPLIKCSIMDDREEFLIYQRENGFSFQTLQLAHYSTSKLAHEIKTKIQIL